MPEPDFALVPKSQSGLAHPTRADLIVEVSFTSLSYDRTEKASLYAKGKMPELWIVNLDSLVCRRSPKLMLRLCACASGLAWRWRSPSPSWMPSIDNPARPGLAWTGTSGRWGEKRADKAQPTTTRPVINISCIRPVGTQLTE